MNKIEELKNLTVHKLDNISISIFNKEISFHYTIADAVVKDELKNKYRYFGGLQCKYLPDSEEYKQLEKWLCEIAESVFNNFEYNFCDHRYHSINGRYMLYEKYCEKCGNEITGLV